MDSPCFREVNQPNSAFSSSRLFLFRGGMTVGALSGRPSHAAEMPGEKQSGGEEAEREAYP